MPQQSDDQADCGRDFRRQSQYSTSIQRTGRLSRRSVGLSHDVDGRPVGVLAGASLVFFAYVGFDAVSTAVEEAREPQRDVPTEF